MKIFMPTSLGTAGVLRTSDPAGPSGVQRGVSILPDPDVRGRLDESLKQSCARRFSPPHALGVPLDRHDEPCSGNFDRFDERGAAGLGRLRRHDQSRCRTRDGLMME
jgi:hypothetical protein